MILDGKSPNNGEALVPALDKVSDEPKDRTSLLPLAMLKLAELASSKRFVIWDLWELRHWFYDTNTSKWIFFGVFNCHDRSVSSLELMLLFNFKGVKFPQQNPRCMFMMTMLFSLALYCGALDRGRSFK